MIDKKIEDFILNQSETFMIPASNVAVLYAEHNIARNTEDDVGGVEQRSSQAEHGGVEPQILAHRQPGKADIDAIEKRKDKQDEEKDDQASEQLVNGAMFNSFIIMGLQGRGRHGALQILRLVDGFIVIN